jgi:hypothetical protein
MNVTMLVKCKGCDLDLQVSVEDHTPGDEYLCELCTDLAVIEIQQALANDNL